MKDSPDTSISVKSSIPTISFHNLHSSSSNDRIDLAKEIHSALSSTSLFYASKTSISSAITTRLHDITKEFFTLPYKEKMKIDGQKEVSMGRGWRCYKQGRECDPSVTDLPETFEMIASPSDDYPPFKSEDYEDGIPNLWPTQPTGFREIICEYNNLIREFSAQLIQLIAVGLGLKENAFENILNPFSGITLLKYPVYTGEDMPVGKGLHTDFSIFTVLTQLTPHHGLQYQHPSSSSTSSPKFISIPHKPETLVIQAGQFLEILAAGMYKAVPHRVVNEEQPDDVEGGRLSVAYFADADPEAWIVPLGKEKREGRRAVEICEVLEGQPNYRRLACYGGK